MCTGTVFQVWALERVSWDLSVQLVQQRIIDSLLKTAMIAVSTVHIRKESGRDTPSSKQSQRR